MRRRGGNVSKTSWKSFSGKTSNIAAIVADTNVILSSLLFPGSTPWRAINRARMEAEFLISTATLEELWSVLLRHKFDRYLSMERRERSFASFVRGASMVTVTDLVTDCRDPKDNKFLELALAGEASLILSGDEDLLVLHPWRSISILSPRNYLAL